MSTCRSVGGGNPFILRVASRLLKQNHSLRSLTVTLGLCLYLCFMICLCVGFLGKRKTNFLSICSDVGNQRVAGNAGWTGDANLMHKLQQLRRSWVPLAGNWSIPLSHEIGGKTTRCSRSQFELIFWLLVKKHVDLAPVDYVVLFVAGLKWPFDALAFVTRFGLHRGPRCSWRFRR